MFLQGWICPLFVVQLSLKPKVCLGAAVPPQVFSLPAPPGYATIRVQAIVAQFSAIYDSIFTTAPIVAAQLPEPSLDPSLGTITLTPNQASPLISKVDDVSQLRVSVLPCCHVAAPCWSAMSCTLGLLSGRVLAVCGVVLIGKCWQVLFGGLFYSRLGLVL